LFSPELVALFIELEAVPARQRDQPWQAKSKRLARWLGLTDEWWRLATSGGRNLVGN
jgi:hypothetical protein